MHIWTLDKWKVYYEVYPPRRQGLRLRIDPDVHPDVKEAILKFAKWLRTEYYFPMRVPVYIKASKHIKALDGELVSATFFKPNCKWVEPYARVSTGDYMDMQAQRGRDNALASILMSIAHELTHYFQWINNLPLTLMGEERQATIYARYIIDEYAETRGHP